LPETLAFRALTAAQLVQEGKGGALILDTRPPEKFAACHIRGSIHISLQGHFSAWAAILIDREQKLTLIAEDARHAEEAHLRLARVGLEHVLGYSFADEKEWRERGMELASTPIERSESIRNTASSPALQLIDVRSRAEWLKGHLPGAISLPLLDIESKAATIDLNRHSLIYCQEGLRATTAASILQRESDAPVCILIDGIEGWLASGLPLEVPANRRFSSPSRTF
jgi:rhodanese-related sulfurtransferase